MASGETSSQSATMTAAPDGHWVRWLSGHQYHHYPQAPTGLKGHRVASVDLYK